MPTLLKKYITLSYSTWWEQLKYSWVIDRVNPDYVTMTTNFYRYEGFKSFVLLLDVYLGYSAFQSMGF